MKHAVIVAHPNPASFTLAVASAYATAASERGHEVILRDLYRLDFDPRLRAEELPGAPGFGPAPDAAAERAAVADAEVFVFVYPLWFYAPPAILVGYLDRIFGMGFGFGPLEDGRNAPLLKGRKMLSFSSTGAPSEWVKQEGALAAVRALFDDHLAAVCGLSVLDHVHFGGIIAGIRPDAVARHLDGVREAVERLF